MMQTAGHAMSECSSISSQVTSFAYQVHWDQIAYHYHKPSNTQSQQAVCLYRAEGEVSKSGRTRKSKWVQYGKCARKGLQGHPSSSSFSQCSCACLADMTPVGLSRQREAGALTTCNTSVRRSWALWRPRRLLLPVCACVCACVCVCVCVCVCARARGLKLVCAASSY